MGLEVIDALSLQKMFLSGAKLLETKKEYINELNVFPVPDGDTGTNMTLTIISAAKEVNALKEPTIESLCKAISGGSLRGARGNSGVILSQLFRGFTKEIKEQQTIDIVCLSKAFHRATETAYKAVMKPKEGTILSVAKAGSQKAAAIAEHSRELVSFAEECLKAMEEALAKTPEQLPVLKEAGVVDSGGEGLVTFLRGCLAALKGEELTFDFEETSRASAGVVKKADSDTPKEITFGYCTEFIILLTGEDGTRKPETSGEKVEAELKAFLPQLGDCVVVVSDDDIVKCHVHTNHPGQVFEKALTYGPLASMKVDNMRLEHQETLEFTVRPQEESTAQEDKMEPVKAEPQKKAGFVSISSGAGLNEIFKDLGADVILEGGQTMNPSTEDVIRAVESVNARTVYILPNNKNIILAANQAQSLIKDKEVVVIPTTTIPQGITALINFLYDKSTEENVRVMTEEAGKVHSGQITYAVRDTQIDGMKIEQEDYMGIGDGKICCVDKDLNQSVKKLIEALKEETHEIVSIYYGEDVSDEAASELLTELEECYSELDIQMLPGGQPIYYYILSVE